jgi:hypothetical protein
MLSVDATVTSSTVFAFHIISISLASGLQIIKFTVYTNPLKGRTTRTTDASVLPLEEVHKLPFPRDKLHHTALTH